jgi:hypothetical protein
MNGIDHNGDTHCMVIIADENEIPITRIGVSPELMADETSIDAVIRRVIDGLVEAFVFTEKQRVASALVDAGEDGIALNDLAGKTGLSEKVAVSHARTIGEIDPSTETVYHPIHFDGSGTPNPPKFDIVLRQASALGEDITMEDVKQVANTGSGNEVVKKLLEVLGG